MDRLKRIERQREDRERVNLHVAALQEIAERFQRDARVYANAVEGLTLTHASLLLLIERDER